MLFWLRVLEVVLLLRGIEMGALCELSVISCDSVDGPVVCQ